MIDKEEGMDQETLDKIVEEFFSNPINRFIFERLTEI